MRRITVTASTIGQSNPAHVDERKNYKFKQDPDWVPNDPRYRGDGRSAQEASDASRAGGNATASLRSAEREQRFAVFTAARDEGLDVVPAGRRAGVQPKTARKYEQERKAALKQQRGETAGLPRGPLTWPPLRTRPRRVDQGGGMLSDLCERGECETCFEDELDACGHECHPTDCLAGVSRPTTEQPSTGGARQAHDPAEQAEPLVIETEGSLLGALAQAVFSPDRAYRYVLTRTWDDVPVMTWVMLNPSTADAMQDDPTIRRCVRFARREGCGGIAVVNLFALRATDPRTLRARPDPVGPANDEFLGMHAKAASLVVAAWGAGGALNGRAREVGQMLASAGVPLKCLGVTSAGHPRHPLYVRSDAPLIPWRAPS